MSNFHSNKWLLRRRHVLRGIGASIALPFLDCMRPARLRAADNLPKPKRSVFIYVPNGVNTLAWQIEKAGPEYVLTAPMQSLEKHRSNITPISGLHHPNGLGQAHECDKIWLTGAKVSQEGGSFRNSVSADQLIAEVTGPHTRFASLELAITGNTLAWSRDGIALPSERKPSTVFNRLFGSEPGGAEAARKNLHRRGSILDLILDDASQLRKNIGSDDRSKLDEYLQAVREVEIRTGRADAWLDVPKPEIDPKTKAHLARDIPPANAGDYYRTIYDLMALALRTDMTRVITCMTGNEGHGLAIPEIGINQTRHQLSHHNGDPEQIRRLTECDTFLTAQFAYFLDGLQSIDEGGEPLLDHTQILFGSGMAYGHSHGNANLPTILAGGRALGLKHGHHLDFNLPTLGAYNVADAQGHYRVCSRPVDSNAHLSNLLLTMLQRVGVETDSFSDSTGTVSDVVS